MFFYAGLVVNYKDEILRVPYWYPFVNLTSRASINSNDTISFTRKIIQLNIDFYNKIKDNKQQVTINEQTIKLFNALNFDIENEDVDTLIKFCQWNLNNLPKMSKKS